MTASTVSPTLSDVVRDAVRANPDVDAARLAEDLLANLPEDLAREAAWRGLEAAIRAATSFSQARRTAAQPQRPQPSWKVTAWQQRAYARLKTEGGSKVLDDCDADDLIFAANYRRRLAEGNLAAATALERLAAEVRKASVSRVGDLSADLVRSILAGTDIMDAA